MRRGLHPATEDDVFKITRSHVSSRRLSIVSRRSVPAHWRAGDNGPLAVGDSVPVASWERIVLAADPLAIVLDSGDIRLRLGRSIRDRTFATLVVGLFALATLLVAAVGLAGVVAYTVAKRTREIAIRLALGATVDDVRRLVVRNALLPATCGIVGGIIASVSLSRVLEGLLYGIHPTDPSTLVLASTGLLGTVLIAAVVPATRAVRISPATALRME
jgi:hypothetical protein